MQKSYPICKLKKKAMKTQTVTDDDEGKEERFDIFADRLAEALVRAQMSQKELAERIGKSEGAVSRWIGEKRLPSVMTVRRISEITRASVDWLLGLPEAPEPYISIDRQALDEAIAAGVALGDALRMLKAQSDEAAKPRAEKRANRTKR